MDAPQFESIPCEIFRLFPFFTVMSVIKSLFINFFYAILMTSLLQMEFPGHQPCSDIKDKLVKKHKKLSALEKLTF